MVYTIVIAEDELLLLNNLIKKIENSNLPFKVVAYAQTGIQAYELIEKHKPDLLITDIKMPTMDGLTLIEKLSSYYPLIECIIISGFSDFEYAKKAIQSQVFDYLLKPIDEKELYSTLGNLQNKFVLQKNDFENYNKEAIGDTPKEIAQTLKNYLLENYDKDIKLTEISKDINYSSSYLSKIFYQEYNCSPNKYLISVRIQKAQQLLKHNTNLSVRQIGEAVGYPEQAYFSRIFKKSIGVSPLDYRSLNL